MRTGSVEIAAVLRQAAGFGFRLASTEELREGLAMAERLIDGELASVEAVQRMNDQTGMTAWVTGQPVDGIFLTLPLSPDGEAAVLYGTYQPEAPDPRHLAWQGKNIAAFYIGIYAGRTHEARKRIMTASAVLRVEYFGAFPAYARGATEDGRRSMTSLGFEPVSGGLPDLYRQAAFTDLLEATHG